MTTEPRLIRRIQLGLNYELHIKLDVADDVVILTVHEPSGAAIPLSHCLIIDVGLLPDVQTALDTAEDAAIAALDVTPDIAETDGRQGWLH